MRTVTAIDAKEIAVMAVALAKPGMSVSECARVLAGGKRRSVRTLVAMLTVVENMQRGMLVLTKSV